MALRRGVDRRIISEVDHVLADGDEVTPDRQIVDCAAVVLGIDDGGRFSGKPREVLIDRQAGDIEFAGRKVFSVTGVASFPARIRPPASSKMRW